MRSRSASHAHNIAILFSLPFLVFGETEAGDSHPLLPVGEWADVTRTVLLSLRLSSQTQLLLFALTDGVLYSSPIRLFPPNRFHCLRTLLTFGLEIGQIMPLCFDRIRLLSAPDMFMPQAGVNSIQ